ncbi:MAG TPA: DsrE family protein [Casimicrobiaceae bacterium]|nr:DsrE family protein [Casimicrobiaceae bacterium]
MKRRSILWACAGLALLTAGCATTGTTQGGDDKVVYHFSEGLEQASDGLRNIGNHLEVNPNAKIVVVSHAKGVDFMMKGVKDKNGNKYEDLVEQLRMRGVQFDVCQITLRNRHLSKDQFIEYATFVPSGVAEISKLEHQGYAYLKP